MSMQMYCSVIGHRSSHICPFCVFSWVTTQPYNFHLIPPPQPLSVTVAKVIPPPVIKNTRTRSLTVLIILGNLFKGQEELHQLGPYSTTDGKRLCFGSFLWGGGSVGGRELGGVEGTWKLEIHFPPHQSDMHGFEVGNPVAWMCQCLGGCDTVPLSPPPLVFPLTLSPLSLSSLMWPLTLETPHCQSQTAPPAAVLIHSSLMWDMEPVWCGAVWWIVFI